MTKTITVAMQQPSNFAEKKYTVGLSRKQTADCAFSTIRRGQQMDSGPDEREASLGTL